MGMLIDSAVDVAVGVTAAIADEFIGGGGDSGGGGSDGSW